jgi:P-type Ca2+ transporter type 2C
MDVDPCRSKAYRVVLVGPKKNKNLLEQAWSLEVSDLLKLTGSDSRNGLSRSAAKQLMELNGPNELSAATPEAWWKRFLRHFNELVVWILLAAVLISGILGDWVDAAAIFAVILLNGILGFLQEERAGRAMEALRKLSAPMAKVIRDGAPKLIPARELVPGDRVEFEAGDNIPADARLIQSFNLSIQEASLTGESAPVEKDARTVLPNETPLGDRGNMVHLGTVVSSGRGGGVVVGTGMSTEMGRIAGMLQASGTEPTPLQKRLHQLGRYLITICLGIVGLILVIYLLRGEPLLEAVLFSVSLAVAAVPEGLPAVVTVALALGLRRMVKRNALIRKLPSVETLGCVTVICSDKTGTLTRNEMTVRKLIVASGEYDVTGIGYEPHGEFKRVGEAGARALNGSGLPGDLSLALSIGAWCNNSSIVQSPEQSESWQCIGDPTEGALIVAARKAGLTNVEREKRLVHENPFDSERKVMSVVIQKEDGAGLILFAKGSPERILNLCNKELISGQNQPLSESAKSEWLRRNHDLASKALRVLAVAYRPVPESDEHPFEEKDLIFVGLVAMMDPPREEVKGAVEKCRTAGIRPVMITGDHADTALAIARELGIANEASRAISGQELDTLSDEELSKHLDDVAVFARVTAQHKLRLVNLFRSQGHVVAMTGDGVNDAPAVRSVDIGIAMGITGTDVTKEASDMILTDDNFTSIVNAVEEGRGIFSNIQKFLQYLLASNASEVIFILIVALAGMPTPLIPIQILWINLVSDSFPALALGMERTEPHVMLQKPRASGRSVLVVGDAIRILTHGSVLALTALGTFIYALRQEGGSVEHARAVAFGVLAYAQIFYALACRSQFKSFFQMGIFSNGPFVAAILISGSLQLGVMTLPFAREVFGVASLVSQDWLLIIGLALVPVTMIETSKFFTRSFRL